MFPRTALVFLGLLLAAFVGIGVLVYTRGPFGRWHHPMSAGASYMRSLGSSDVPPWIERTKRLLGEWQPGSQPMGVYGLGGKPIPADLQQLGLVRIDILREQVRYVWMGGMDHTELEVDRLPDASFGFLAHYNDAQGEVIWPKGPNHAMQPTPGRRTLRFCMTPTSSSAAKRALIHSRDSFSLRPGVYVAACQSAPFASGG